MRKMLLLSMILTLILAINTTAQQSGAFVASLGIGLTSAQGDFADPAYLSAGSGSGVGAQVTFYPVNGFGIGGFAHYMRFGSDMNSGLGRMSFNFTQMGGLAKLNLIPLSNGTIYVTGGAGLFTPSAHIYVTDNSYDLVGNDQGFFGFGGVGLSSDTHSRLMYELEMRYNLGDADYTFEGQEQIITKKFDFIYLGIKLSLSSKGRETPSRF